MDAHCFTDYCPQSQMIPLVVEIVSPTTGIFICVLPYQGVGWETIRLLQQFDT